MKLCKEGSIKFWTIYNTKKPEINKIAAHTIYL